MKLSEYSKTLIKNPKDAELRKEYYKRCYELFDSVNGDNKKLMEIANEEGISVQTIRLYAKEYYDKYVKNLEGKTWTEKYVYSKAYYDSKLSKPKSVDLNSSRNLLFLKLMEEERREVIIELIKESGLDYRYLKRDVSDFVVNYFPNQKDYLIDNLKNKIDIFLEYASDERKKLRQQQKELEKQEYLEFDKESFEKEKFWLEEFIVGTYESKQQYCSIRNINMKYFDELVDRAKIYDIKLYHQYESVINNNSKRRFAIIVNSIKMLVNYLKNGIKDDDGNKVRDFDIIDYYLLIKLDFETILNVINNVGLTNDELRILRTFIAKNKNNIKDKSNDVHQILNPNNKQIIGGRVIELAEKELILNFLWKNKIPKNSTTYNIALRRYLNNTLLIDEVKGNTKA